MIQIDVGVSASGPAVSVVDLCGPCCISHQRAETLSRTIGLVLERDVRPLTVSFAGVRMLTALFINAAITPFLHELGGLDTLRQRLRFTDIGESQMLVIEQCLQHAQEVLDMTPEQRLAVAQAMELAYDEA